MGLKQIQRSEPKEFVAKPSGKKGLTVAQKMSDMVRQMNIHYSKLVAYRAKFIDYKGKVGADDYPIAAVIAEDKAEHTAREFASRMYGYVECMRTYGMTVRITVDTISGGLPLYCIEITGD